MTLKVLYLTGYSSEHQLSEPIIRRMKADPYFEVDVLDVFTPDEHGRRTVFPPYADSYDVVISPCDRVEMVEPTFKMFLQNKPIVRIYAGINTSGGTHDDVIRRMLDSMGHILMTESEECKSNLIKSGEEKWRIHVVGVTHWDLDEPLDYSMCWSVPYAVFLMNPVTINKDQTALDCQRALIEAYSFLNYTPNGHISFLPPNGDKYSEVIKEQIESFASRRSLCCHFYRERLKRETFLGLLSRAKLYISNSSSGVYEAKKLAIETYNPSWRNQERTPAPALMSGGAQRIVDVLKGINWSAPHLLRKRFQY